jgi:hypothetical protein
MFRFYENPHYVENEYQQNVLGRINRLLFFDTTRAT